MGGFIDDVISFIGRPFGVYTHNETFTDLQVSNLLTPGEADKNARKTAKYHAKGNAMEYFQGYRQFQRDYRKKYSQQFMERQGYDPSSTATATIATEEKTELYLEGLYGYVDVNVEEYGDRFLSLSEKGTHAVQQIAGYDFPTGRIITGGKNYNSHQYVELPDDTQLEVTSTRLYDETIVQNFTDNYAYDGAYAYTSGEQYLVGALSSAVNGSDEYETVCVHQPKDYADIIASATIVAGDSATVSYPDDVDTNGFVTLDEVTGGSVNILVTLPVSAAIDNTLRVTIDGVDTDYTVDQAMIDNGLTIEYSGYTTATMAQLPDLTVYTPVERIVNVVTNTAYGTEVSYASYRVASGEIGTEKRYWVVVSGTVTDIYDTVVLNITTIVPMKEDNVMVDTDNYKLNRMLRKLNLSGDQLKSSIENPDMDSAYLMTGIDPQYNDPIINEVLFKMFDLISPGSGNITISISKLSMKYTFTLQESLVSGSIGAVGDYTRSQTGTGAGVVLTLRYQGDTNEYKQLIVSNFVQTYTISGKGFTAYLDSTGGYCRLAIPLNLLNSLPYKKFEWVYGRSLCMLAYATDTVEVKWYETGAFGTLLKIVGIVLTIISLGSVLAAGQTMFAASYGLAAAIIGGPLTLAMVQAVIILEFVVVAALASVATGFLAEQIGGAFGAVLAAVGTLVLAKYGSNGASTSFTAEQWLMAADKTLSTYMQWISHKMETLQMEAEAFMEDIQNEIDELREKNEEFGNDVGRNFTAAIGAPNSIYNTIDRYCSEVYTTSVEHLVEYGNQIAYAVKTRTNVWTGP